MDQLTASYYRAILFHGSADQQDLPPTLKLLHAWAFKRFQALGAGPTISKQAALFVAMTWMTSTKDGRVFAREQPRIGELFCWDDVDDDDDDTDADDEPSVTSGAKPVDWDAVPIDSKVVVIVDAKPTAGEFLGRRGSWIDVRLGGESKPFRSTQVQLAGA